MKRLWLPLLAALVYAAGCAPPAATPAEDLLVKKPAPMQTMTTAPTSVLPSGVKLWDLKPGEGAPLSKGQQATIHYVGWLADGTRFDSSRANGRPYVFTVGATNVIPGMSEGVVGMRLGGRRRLEIPPKMAYGEEGRPPVIPANSTLIFEVELQQIAQRQSPMSSKAAQ